jgi:hypothetical protein
MRKDNKHFLIAFAAFFGLMGFGLYALGQTSQPTVNTVPAPSTVWVQAGIESRVKTYKYSSLGNVPAATATDLLTITGSTTKTVRVQKIVVGGGNSAALALRGVQIIRRSTADTTGTSTAPTPLSRDTTNSTASATLALYTVNPGALGTAVGTIDSCRLTLILTTTPVSLPDVCSFTYGVNNDQMSILRGTLDILAINFLGAAAGVTATAATDFIDLDIEWAEEP